MNRHFSLALDGPSGAGKSTVADELAGKYGFHHIDTGAIYRTVALATLRRGISGKDANAVTAMLALLKLTIEFDAESRQQMILNGENVTPLIRTPEVGRCASDVSAIPAVRDFLLEQQRSLAKSYDVIMDGRDIGTVVLPDATLKIFLTASDRVRATRRQLEYREQGREVPYDEILESIRYRDEQDTNREIAPLKKAEDAIVVDSGSLSFEQTAAVIGKYIDNARRIEVAEHAGFCFGVSRSVGMAEEELSKRGTLYCLGDLIHNRDEVNRLEAMGLRVVQSARDVPENSAVIIRSHGVPHSDYEVLHGKNCEIIDATCPRVLHIHKIAEQSSEQGKPVIIIGAADHQEVRAIRGWCNRSFVAENAEELEQLLKNNPELTEKPATVVFQTTSTKKVYEKVKNFSKNSCTNLEIFDTICFATQTRQAEALELASRSGAMVVVGGKHSANSTHLAELCAEKCRKVLFVENAAELNTGLLNGISTIGVTAGASVPARIIKEVKQKMSEEIKTTPVETEESFEALFEASIKTIYNGETVTGTVAAISATEVTVDLGMKQTGFIPLDEFTADGTVKPEDAIHVGDEITAEVVQVRDGEGTIKLSKKRLDAKKIWADLNEMVESGEAVEGTVTASNKGGLVVTVKGARVFVPFSQSGLPKDADPAQAEAMIGQTVRLRIRSVDRGKKDAVGSIRDVTMKERRAREDAIWDNIEVGKEYDGTVKSLTPYGAFVDIGGVDGMVHVSELTWKRINRPADFVSVGDPLHVFVLSFDKEKHRISLGCKKAEDNPWTVFTGKYQVGDVAPVRIVKFMTFGAFAEVVPGADGLIHISQIANRRIAKCDEVLAVGDVVDAKIIGIDEEKHKISLSIRALIEPEAAPVPVAEEAAEEEPEAEGDALVYEVATDGTATGVVEGE